MSKLFSPVRPFFGKYPRYWYFWERKKHARLLKNNNQNLVRAYEIRTILTLCWDLHLINTRDSRQVRNNFFVPIPTWKLCRNRFLAFQSLKNQRKNSSEVSTKVDFSNSVSDSDPQWYQGTWKYKWNLWLPFWSKPCFWGGHFNGFEA